MSPPRPVVELEHALQTALARIAELEAGQAARERTTAGGEPPVGETNFRGIVESVGAVIAVLDRTGKVLYANPACLSVWNDPDVVGKTLFDVYPREVAERYQVALLQVLETEMTIDDEIDNMLEKRVGWFRISLQPLRNLAGIADRILLTAWEVTEQHTAHEKMTADEERYRTLSMIASDYVFRSQVRPDGSLGLIWVAGAFETISGYSMEEYIARGGWRSALYPDDVALDDDAMATLHRNQSVISEVRTIAKNGEIVWVRTYAKPVWDETANQLAGINGAVQNITTAKRADEVLRASEARMTRAQTIAHVGNWELDLQSKTLWASEEAIRIYGGDPSTQMLPMSVPPMYVMEEDRPRLDQAMDRMLAGEADGYDEEFQIRRANDNAIRYVRSKAEVVWGSDGKAEKVLGVIQDVTEQKLAEIALRDSEVRFRALIENAPGAVVLVSKEGVFKYISSSTYRLMGYNPESSLALDPAAYTHPNDLPALLEVLNEVMQQPGAVRTVQYRFRHQDGSWRWLESTISNLLLEPSVEALVLNYQDITDRKDAELRLEQRVRERTAEIDAIRQRLELATTAARLGIWDFNFKTRQLLLDDQMLQLGGMTRDEFDGTLDSYLARIHPQDRAHLKLLQSVAHEAQFYEREFRVVWSDQSVHTIAANALILRDAGGQPERLVGINRDITAQKQAEEVLRSSEETLLRANSELARAMRMKDEFLASMSHELRTPLTGILGLSEVLQLKVYGELNPRQRKAISHIEQSGRHLLELINDILDLSKMEANKLELQIQPCPVGEICQSSLQLVKGMAQKKGQHVGFTMNPATITMKADVRRLKQILVNLLGNAIKFTPDGGALGLDVTGDETRQTVRFTIWDNGIGINAQDLERLFQPFVQVDSSLARQQSGTGLGLSLVQRLTELHGGKVYAESTAGRGSRFTVTLPWPRQDDAELQAAGPAKFAALQRILTVEDSLIDAEHLTQHLRLLGIENIVYHEGHGAVDYAIQIQPGAILLDIGLPGKSGWDVLRELKTNEHTRAIPVIITSIVENRSQANAFGAAAYLVKPFTHAELREALALADTLAPLSEPVLVVAEKAVTPLLMLVDDNPVTVESLRDYLESKNLAVIMVSSGWDFLARVTQIRPHVVLMDIQMPGLDGLETIRRLRAHTDPELATLPIIALTALTMPGDRERCLAAGANAYLSKPIELQGLVATVWELLKKADAPR
jgi:PAS domain S-box-containing protein